MSILEKIKEIPTWGWILIGVAVVGIAVGIIFAAIPKKNDPKKNGSEEIVDIQMDNLILP